MTTKPKTVPELRFPGFEGEWRRWLLDQFATRGSGHTPSKSHPEYYDGDIDWISLADSKRLDNGYIEKTKTKISDLGLRHSSAVLHPAGTVILSRDAGVGKSAVMKHTMAVSQHFIVWRPTEGTSIDWFIYYWLQIMKPEFERIAIGSTIKTIGLPYFKKLEISAPTLPEQRKIADFLTAVDGRIGQLSQKKALLEDYKKGVMQQLFTQALRFKDKVNGEAREGALGYDHGNDFPEWEEKKLGAVCRILKGKGLSKADLADDGAIPCIRYGELYTIYSELIQETKSRTNVVEKELVLSEENDVIIPASGETHIDIATASCVMSKGIALGGDLNIIRTKLNGVFLAYYLNNACKHAIASVAQGSSVIHLYPDQLKGLSLRFPSANEQTKIANFLTALDRKIESVSSQITHTQTFKKGLLQQMFV